MADVIVMPTVQSLDPALQEQIRESDRCIRQTWTSVRKMSMLIGWEGSFLQRAGAWEFLGFKHQHEYRIAVGIGRSNWYRLIAIAEKFIELDKDTFLSMSIENAERLGLEPPKIRYNPENVRLAATMMAKEFKDAMTTAGAHREGRPVHEHWVTMEMRMKEEQQKVIEAGLKGWAQEHDIDNIVYALELLVAEYTQRPTLAGFILDSIHGLTESVRNTKEPEEIRGLMCDHIKSMYEILTTCCGETEEVA